MSYFTWKKKKKNSPTHNVRPERFHNHPDLSFLHCFPNLLIHVIDLDEDLLRGHVGGGGFHGKALGRLGGGGWLLNGVKLTFRTVVTDSHKAGFIRVGHSFFPTCYYGMDRISVPLGASVSLSAFIG